MSSSLADPVPLPEVHRVLVTKLRHHGDVLLATPVFATLARAIPAAEIDALVYKGTEPMLARHPAIAQVHTIDRSWKERGVVTQVGEEWRLMRHLRARHYDLLIHLTEHPRGLHLARLLRPRWSVTRERPSLSAGWRRKFTHLYRQPDAARRHTVEANLDALRRIGIYPEPADRRVELVPGPDAQAKAQALLSQHELAPRGFLHVHPGSRWLFKCWPAVHTAALLDRIVTDGFAVVVTGAPEERERALVASIMSALKPATRARTVDLSAQLTLQELAALTAHARAFVGVDSAPMHIAAAMGTPTVALFGPSGEMQWGPWGVASRVIASDSHPCRPCGLDGCGGGKVSDCLTSLPVDRVHSGLRALLAETGGTA
ncbi:MAG: putative lipopolysaccharide heptosyltransferase III [Betaproteobacteria bacterium]